LKKVEARETNKSTSLVWVVAFSVLVVGIFSYNSWARPDLITELREAFGISSEEATNDQLKQFLKDRNNHTFAEGMLKQIRHGQQLQHFLAGQSNQLPNVSKEALKYLGRKLVIDLIKLIDVQEVVGSNPAPPTKVAETLLLSSTKLMSPSFSYMRFLPLKYHEAGALL